VKTLKRLRKAMKQAAILSDTEVDFALKAWVERRDIWSGEAVNSFGGFHELLWSARRVHSFRVKNGLHKEKPEDV
jgi:hypothetical protein